MLKSESKFSNTATAKSDTNINTNTSTHSHTHTGTQLHIAERKWVMHSLPLKRPSSSSRAVWQHYLRDGGLNKLPPTSLATLAGAAPPCVWRLMQQPAQQDWTNYRRTCKFTQDLAAHSYMYTHIQVHVLTCTRVVAKYFQRVRGRGTTNVNMHSNGGAASRAGVNVTKCCQTFARTLAWQRQNANVHTQFHVCVCVFWTEREATENQSA